MYQYRVLTFPTSRLDLQIARDAADGLLAAEALLTRRAAMVRQAGV